ncbi:MAG: EAL domain-containing protein, partial [Myxococcales bacterium]|nr:EAL domain-containing protein [Myxococcales bacterium]
MTVRLPPARPDTDDRDATRSSARGRVLVVDDSRATLTLISSMLRSWGYEAVAVEDPLDALALFEAGEAPFDTVLTDIQMPSMSGVELLRRVRERDRDVPIVLLTGTPSLDSAIQGIEFGAFRYLTKPLDLAKFRETIERAVGLARLSRFEREASVVARREAIEVADDGLSARFSRALGTLWLAFQPILGHDGRPYGYEALMRPDDPKFPNPGTLLEAAEQLGRLHELGRLIRAKAAAVMSAHPDRGALFVNLHPLDLLDDELYSADAPLAAISDRVVLEITERAGLTGVDDVRGRLHDLRALGYRVAIDDLGNGHSGLTNFTLLEPDFVKIDMSLVRDIDKSRVKRRIVRSMTDLCRDLRIAVVAEGVETAAERDVLV